MPKYTIAAQLIAGLHREGHRRLPKATSTKYVVFEHHTAKARNLYVGPSGALRIGPTIAQSQPCNQRTRLYYLDLGMTALAEAKAKAKTKAVPRGVLTIDDI